MVNTSEAEGLKQRSCSAIGRRMTNAPAREYPNTSLSIMDDFRRTAQGKKEAAQVSYVTW